jgi:hypothetical protein
MANSDEIRSLLLRGLVIPAMPLALDEQRRLDERRQRALARYYIDAGAGGLAVGVHTTQFAIREPGIGLFEPLLALVSAEIDTWGLRRDRRIVKIAGVCGRTEQARREAEFAQRAGYDTVLLNLTAFDADSPRAIIGHCREMATIIPLVGFYLQPAVGGRVLPYGFWRAFAEIENVLAIKIAPFNRYQTLDVVRAVCMAGREREIALYTGNDDNIVADLLTEYAVPTPMGTRRARMVGGLLGHWAVWTQKAVALLEEIHALTEASAPVPPELLTRAARITDCNAAFFDATHNYAGCISGIHTVLQRQGLLAGTWTLDPHETLSPGQFQEIARVYHDYPELNDNAFVRANLATWLA